MTSVAVIGLGERIAQVLPHLLACDKRLKLVGYADPSPTGLGALARHDIAPGDTFDDPARMLNVLKPDLVMIGSPNHLHLDHLRLALSTGAKIFCEKPIVRTEEESYALAELLAETGDERLMVGLVLRSAPMIHRVSNLLKDGRIGRVVSMEANENLHPEHGAFLMKDWRRLQRWGGSFLLDKCCHDFDVYRLFVGSRPSRVASFGRRSIFTEDNAALEKRVYPDGRKAYGEWSGRWAGEAQVFDSDADVNDVQVAIVDYENGTTLAFHANSCTGFNQRRWHIAGTEASLAVDLYKGRIVIGDPIGRGRAEKLDFAGETSFDAHEAADPAMARDIAASLFDGRKFPVTAYDALVAGLTVMAIDRAAATGTVVDCTPIWKKLDALYPRANEKREAVQ